jgi:hypothetical protein
MLISSVVLAMIVSIVLFSQALRLNLYLAFLFLMSATTFVPAMVFVMPIDGLGYAFVLYLVWFFTSITALHLFRHLSSDLRKSVLDQHALGYKLKAELLIAMVLVLTFYLILTPQVLTAPWWLDDQSRVAYMSDGSTLLRGVKLTPVILASIALAKPVLRRRDIILLMAISVLFSFYVGSKSGMLFLIATIALHATVYRIRPMVTVRTFSLPVLVFLVFIVFFFLEIAANADVTLAESLLLRQDSDVRGLTALFDIDTLNACKNMSYLAPIQSTISKIIPLVERPFGHLSYGSCLASPSDPSYPFELLTPLFFEIYGIYGSELVFPLGGLILLLIVIQFKILGKIGKLFDVRAISIGAQGYFSYSMPSILYGGKYTNHLASDYINVIMILVFAGVIKKVLFSGARSRKTGFKPIPLAGC